jgi:hypothetical protein
MIGSYLRAATRFVMRRVRVGFFGLKKYPGNDEAICRQIIIDCYDQEKKHFAVSRGHFCEFYCRDFGWCAEALLSLGFRNEVMSTLDYAFSAFEQHGRIEQSISSSGKPFTFPAKYSPDALAFMIRTLKLAKADELVKKYKDFLGQEVRRYYDIVIDKKTGLVRKDCSFSSMKDYAVRQSSCYDNVMTAMLANDLPLIGLYNPFKKWNYKKLIINYFWNGEYFFDDLSDSRVICGDANVMPFWSGILDDKAMLKKAVNTVRSQALDKPFPLKYAKERYGEQKAIWQEIFAGNYERNSIWAHVGLMYIRVVAQIDKKLVKEYLAQYKKQIEKYRTFLEVYDSDGKPFKNLFYYTDESMLWAANYLFMSKKL